MRITNVILPDQDQSQTYNVKITDNKIQNIEQCSTESRHDSPPSLLLPSLCHPHIHLDKPYLLTCHNKGPDLPDYSDLVPESGEFKEALANTGAAKSRYTHADLIRRGSQLIAESIQAGVSSMRAFVEIDHVTQFKCVEAGIELKKRFKDLCHVQLCAFAQDPVFSTEHGEENRRLIEKALEKYSDVEVIGSTPYVEESVDKQKENICWAVQQAKTRNLHLDFHLDYNLDVNAEPMIWKVVEELKASDWTTSNTDKTVVIGHCTRMTLFSHDDMERLSREIVENNLPISFVGLPTSDKFMMGRPGSASDWGGSRPRGSIQVLELIKKFKLNAAIGINNVGNAFTPWGNADPLRLASLGVGLYHAGTPKDAQLLFESVSSRARSAIGAESSNAATISSLGRGKDGPFLCIKNEKSIELLDVGQEVPARQRINVADVVWDPPELCQRQVIR